MPHLFRSVGSLSDAYAAVDWSATPLGAVESWSPALRNAVDLTLNTRFPITLMWGPEFVMVYNEAYVQMIGEKHPAALGARAQEVFPEAWDYIGGILRSVSGGDGANYVEDASVPLRRAGFLEECYFTFSYSPVHGPDGTVEGVMDIAHETTAQVLSARRLGLLATLQAAVVDLEDSVGVVTRAREVLADAEADLTEVEIRLDRQGFLLQRGVHRRRDGEALALRERPDGVMAELALAAGTPYAGSRLLVGLSPHLAPDEDYLGFLRLVADVLGRALERVSRIEAERSLSEAFQRSLLTTPVATDGARVAVRYQPAADDAQVGGDWHDAFFLPDGTMTLVIGDVAGHDESAAAMMAQIRNVLRGVAHATEGSPSEVLSRLDRAMTGFAMSVVATAVVVQVREQGDGTLRLTWSSAGHPPPVVIAADGRASLLERKPGLLLGLDPLAARVDHELVLEAGASLVLYTDGLVERRGASITAGLTWLQAECEGRHGLLPDALCDHLLAKIGDAVDDDVAMLVLRAAL